MTWLRQLGATLQSARGWFHHRERNVPVNEGYVVVAGNEALGGSEGWLAAAVAQRQWAAFRPLVEALRQGQPRRDFVVLAEAVARAGAERPLIVEAGCASGWNGEVLARLWNRPMRYIGLDYSAPMVALARQLYPGTQFMVGDTTALPLAEAACDILVSGTVLMHVRDYPRAISESQRVSRRWGIFHTVPVMQRRATTLLRKRAYGEPVNEVIFNEAELKGCFAQARLSVEAEWVSLPYDLEPVLGEPTQTKTYLCRKLH